MTAPQHGPRPTPAGRASLALALAWLRRSWWPPSPPAATPSGTSGAPATAAMADPDIFVSADGTHVAFTSEDHGLAGDGTGNNQFNLYVRELRTGTTRFVAFDLRGDPIDRASNPSLSADDNDGADVYLYQLATGELELVSVAPDGTAGTPRDVSGNVDQETGISAEGRYVAFTYRSGVVPGDDAEPVQVYVRDREAETTTRISTTGSGQFTPAAGRPQVSDDGRWVAFTADRELLEGTEGGCGVYRYGIGDGGLTRMDLGQAEITATNCTNRVDVADDGAVVYEHRGALHAATARPATTCTGAPRPRAHLIGEADVTPRR